MKEGKYPSRRSGLILFLIFRRGYFPLAFIISQLFGFVNYGGNFWKVAQKSLPKIYTLNKRSSSESIFVIFPLSFCTYALRKINIILDTAVYWWYNFLIKNKYSYPRYLKETYYEGYSLE